MNVGVAVARTAVRSPEAVAAFDGARRTSYRELDRTSNRLANLLLAIPGIGRGDRIALLVHNRLEVVEVMAGVAKAGLTYVGLNFRMTAAEFTGILENAEPRLLITEGEFAELAHQLCDRIGIPVLDLDDMSSDGYRARLETASPSPPATLHAVRPEDDFCIVYTSGTTGTPKGVHFDHGQVLVHAIVACIEFHLTDRTRYLMAIPHNSSVNIALVPGVLVGAAIGFIDSRGWDPQRFAAEVGARAATHSYLVPTQIYRLLDTLRRDSAALATIDTLGYGAAPISYDRACEFLERYGPVLVQLYGMAEIASIGTMLRKDDHARALAGERGIMASAGRASYAVDVRVVDDAMNDVPVGARGEVVFAGPHVMKGYFRDPERTAQTLIDGWIHSGDIAHFDPAGYLYIVDRKKELIIRGGQNIAPSEIEEVLYRHPSVLEAAAVGIPDPAWGESILAVVALRPGTTAGAGELLEWCRRQGLPGLKLPARVEIVEALPKNAVGKIAKNEIRQRHWSGTRQV